VEFQRIRYADLNARQQENYNCQKLAAKLADYGFICIRLSDDWQGADLIACHLDGKTSLRIQLKGRYCVDQKYRGKDLYIGFRDDEDWYVYPHDDVLNQVLSSNRLVGTKSWDELGCYSFPGLSKQDKDLLEQYRLP